MSIPTTAQLSRWAIPGAVIFAFVAWFMAGQLSAEHQVRKLVQRQIELINDGDMSELANTLSSDAQAACPEATMTSLMSRARTNLVAVPTLSISNLAVKVEGTRATVTGDVLSIGQTLLSISEADPAVYIKTDDGWKLDFLQEALDICSGDIPTHI